MAAILHGYLGIRLRQNNLLIAAFCAAVHVIVVVAYCGVFHRAYRLQELQKTLKRELIMAVCGESSGLVKQEIRKGVSALSCPGLKVGGFHEMERQSALIFISFVGNQITSLLVTF